MAKAHQAWTVLSHGPIERVSERIWRVEGALPNMPLKRVMTVACLADGRLVVHNAIALDEAAMGEIDGWGRVAFILVPNAYHRLDAAAFAKRYPDAKVLCPSGARAKVADVVRVDGTYDDFSADAHVALQTLDGVAEQEGVMLVRDSSGATLVLNDVVFNMPHVGGVQGFVLRHVTGSTGGPKISRVGRMFLVKQGKPLAQHLRRLAETEGLARLIVSHHEMIDKEPARVLRDVAATL